MPSTSELNQAQSTKGTVTDRVPCISADALLLGEFEPLEDVVRSACLNVGFFCVELTAAQRRTIGATLCHMERFFLLDDDDVRKQSLRQGVQRNTGWVPRYTEPAYQPGTVSSLEAFDFDISNIRSADNQDWPDLPEFRVGLTRCWDEYVSLGNAILAVVARAAGIRQTFLQENCNSWALSKMRLLNYAAETRQDDQAVGIAAHTDFECITLLYQTAAGLELLDANGQWLDAPIAGGRLVVLLGDMLERWTNGVFSATGHRVRNTSEQRNSIVMFVAANEPVEIAPLPQFITNDAPARYPPVSQGQHIDNEIRRAKANTANK